MKAGKAGEEHPTRIGPFAVEEVLSAQAQGRVYRVRDHRGQALALKLLDPQSSARHEARIQQEAGLLRVLGRHRHIVSWRGCGWAASGA